MAPDGTARTVDGPIVLDGKQCLAVICDHRSAATVDAAKPRVVRALRQAARFKKWAPFESVDISVQWPHVFVCHTVRGLAVLPAGAFISTAVLTDSPDFEVAGHHVADLPVSAGVLASGLALQVWDLPLVSAAVALHANLSQFMFAMMQGAATMEAQRHNSLSGTAVSASLRATSEAITAARRGVVIAYQHFAALLEAHVNGATGGAFGHALGELDAIVQG
jgi:hypothetical protein